MATLYVRPGGNDSDTGLSPGNALATLSEALSRFTAGEPNIIDLSGHFIAGDDVGLVLPDAADQPRFRIPPVGHRSLLVEAPVTIRALPNLVETLTGTVAVVQQPPHLMAAITVSPSPGWTEDVHRGRMAVGQGFFECGAICSNTADTLYVAYGPQFVGQAASAMFTAPIEILEHGATLEYGRPSAGFEFNPGLVIHANCASVWQWIKFAMPAGNPATGVAITGSTARAQLFNCAFDGLTINGSALVDIDGCYIERSWSFNGSGDGCNMRRTAVVGALAGSHSGSYFMVYNRFRECGPLGTGGTGHFAGTTVIENVEHVDGIRAAVEYQGQGRHTIRNCLLQRAGGSRPGGPGVLDHGIDANGQIRLIVDNVDGVDNGGFGLSAKNGAQVEVRNDPELTGALGDIRGGKYVAPWSAVPFDDIGAMGSHLVRVHLATDEYQPIPPTMVPPPLPSEAVPALQQTVTVKRGFEGGQLEIDATSDTRVRVYLITGQTGARVWAPEELEIAIGFSGQARLATVILSRTHDVGEYIADIQADTLNLEARVYQWVLRGQSGDAYSRESRCLIRTPPK